jgi:predicted signal transduction protein with EAL and GGDEF domain
MVLSLNGCIEIATSLGHDIADSYVRQAAEQLQVQIAHGFMLARLENDSFLVVMPGLDTPRAADVAEQLLKSLEPGIGLPNVTVHARPVAGIAVYPDHGETHDQLLLRATVAQPGTGDGATVGLYHRGEEDRRIRRLTIISDLRRAVYHEEFKLFYQPKIALADGSVCGAEALLRWDHPTLGPLSPAEFIPIAEQSGNISMLTRWALKAAVRECRYWQEQGLDIPVSVNLSASDLMDKELPSFVMSVLRNHDLEPRYLVAEITEEGLVRDFDNAAILLQRLRDLGIRISIDDFGTGYSSLAQIRKLPVDELKLDKSFVTRLPEDRADAAIVKATIDLAHNLGMEFVAEGVETQSALSWLREHGCERIQGFYISPPVPADAFINWVGNYANGSAMRVPAFKAG